MEATNLRIGNLVGIKKTALHAEGSFEHAYFTIEELKKDVVQFKGYSTGEYYKDLKGIKINEGLLSLYGFVEETEDNFTLRQSPIVFTIHRNLITKQFMCRLEINHSFLVETLHELQNLFFDITKRELELKHKSSACS